MRFLVVVLALTFICACGVAAEPADEATQKSLINKADKFVECLEKGEYSQATDLFDAKMKELMPADKLSASWTGVATQIGKYLGRNKPVYGIVKGYDSVDISCRFEKSGAKLRLMFDKDKNISGMWYLPPDEK